MYEVRNSLKSIADSSSVIYYFKLKFGINYLFPICNSLEGNPYFKIIRADENHMLLMSFSTMMKNFDREDLESLWKIVRERFEKTEPKNYSDDYLLNTLKIMFENPNVEASVWKDQKGKYGLAKVKSWKLIESSGVQFKRSKRLTNTVMKYQALKRKPLTEAQARRNMIVYLKNMAGYKMDYFKGMSYDDIRPLFEKHYSYNQAFLDEMNEGVKALEKEVRQEKEVEVESSKREGKSLEQEIANKKR
nr:hypothetical protein [Tanacetum cinerariifolium]